MSSKSRPTVMLPVKLGASEFFVEAAGPDAVEEVPETWELAGWAGVDSGLLMVGDPCYVADMSPIGSCLTELDYEDGVLKWQPHGQCIAVVADPGDGLYPVSVLRDADGRVTAMRVDLTHEARVAAHLAEDGS